jgi:thioredoxin-related protein
MKKLFAVLMMGLLSLSATAQTRLEDAKKTAADQNQLIVLNFSGSDWCIPCIKLHKNIIESEDFKKLSADHVITYLNADFPRNKKKQPSAVIKKENGLLAEQYNPNGLFPW